MGIQYFIAHYQILSLLESHRENLGVHNFMAHTWGLLIRVFAVRMKKAWILIYQMSALPKLWSDWADSKADLSLRWAHRSFCWFCHEAAHIFFCLVCFPVCPRQMFALFRVALWSSVLCVVLQFWCLCLRYRPEHCLFIYFEILHIQSRLSGLK